MKTHSTFTNRFIFYTLIATNLLLFLTILGVGSYFSTHRRIIESSSSPHSTSPSSSSQSSHRGTTASAAPQIEQLCHLSPEKLTEHHLSDFKPTHKPAKSTHFYYSATLYYGIHPAQSCQFRHTHNDITITVFSFPPNQFNQAIDNATVTVQHYNERVHPRNSQATIGHIVEHNGDRTLHYILTHNGPITHYDIIRSDGLLAHLRIQHVVEKDAQPVLTAYKDFITSYTP